MRNTVKTNVTGLKMIAHRGLSKLELENTKEAMIAACNRSYYGIETDVRLTKDQQLILYHDDDLKRLAHLDKKVNELTLEELNNLVLNNPVNYIQSIYRILLFEDYLKILKEYQKKPIIEIKGEHNEESLKRILLMTLEYFEEAEFVFISFNLEYLKYMRFLNKNLNIQYLFGEKFEENLQYCIQNHFDADVHYNLITPENVTIMRKNQLRINVWTVDDLNWVLEHSLDVDYITTNILE